MWARRRDPYARMASATSRSAPSAITRSNPPPVSCSWGMPPRRPPSPPPPRPPRPPPPHPPPRLMLVEHDAQRPAFPRNAVPLQRRKEVLLFLAVVAAIGEGAKEVDEPRQSLSVHRPAPVETLAEPLQELQRHQEHHTLVAGNGGGRGRRGV